MSRSRRVPPGVYEGHGWVLLIELGHGSTKTIVVPPNDAPAAEEAEAAIREALAGARASGGCRTVTIAVHVQGAACDHEVRF